MPIKVERIILWVEKTNKPKNEVIETAWNYCLDHKLLAYWPVISERIMATF